MAERGGFEPPVQCYPYNCLAGSPVRPLRHLSKDGLTNEGGLGRFLRKPCPKRLDGGWQRSIAGSLLHWLRKKVAKAIPFIA
jgi:hypothetical protein